MSERKEQFTPGPWHAERHQDAPYDQYTVYSPDNHVACLNEIDTDDLSLVLAAPALYEALVAFLSTYERCKDVAGQINYRVAPVGEECVVAKVRAALAKARGEK